MSLTLEDRLDIYELIARYGHLIDERRFGQLGEIFCEDATFELLGFDEAPGDTSRCDGLADITRMMEQSQQHPLGHHATNVVVEAGDPVRVISKGIGVGHGGKVGSVVYRDCVRRTELGWRIAERVCELRRADL
ncbi:MAG: nuclear transport factor 2 family protein [Halieaceae bacterium]|nr:nuclear transport factor 2 family protein [Halieaceae bacterium]